MARKPGKSRRPKKLTGHSIIYGLADPFDMKIRYIGQTKNAARREWQHSSLTNNKSNRRVSVWIRALADVGRVPSMVVIEALEGADRLNAREKYWLAHYRDAGSDLLNMNDGGKGMEQCRTAALAVKKGEKRDAIHDCRMDLRLRLNEIRRRQDKRFLPLAEVKVQQANDALDRLVARMGKASAIAYMEAALAFRAPHWRMIEK